jgi:hypothetical protein
MHHIENCSRCNRKREIWPSRAIAAAALIADDSTFREVGLPSEEKGTAENIQRRSGRDSPTASQKARISASFLLF